MLSIIIVSWNVRDLLRNCLRSLQTDLNLAGLNTSHGGSQKPSQDLPGLADAANIIVVDSASSDGTPDMLRAEFPEVELIASETNIGYVRGNNLALRRVSSDSSFVTRLGFGAASSFLWLLNPDTVIQPGATRTLIDFMQAHPRCGLCGPQLQNVDGSLQHGAFELPGLMQLAIDVTPRLQARFRNTRWDGRYAPATYASNHPFKIGSPLGAAMLARAEAVAEVSLLDEGFEMYCEELDWAARMHKANWEVWCVPQAVVTHIGGASSGQASERAERLKWQSRQRYYAKHYSLLKRWVALRIAAAHIPPSRV
jgi:hypothetical protein